VELTLGTSARPEQTLLISRALDFLVAGPADCVPLVEHICQLPGAPRVVAEHMVEALLGGHPAFARGADGRWWLAAQLERELAAVPAVPGVPADLAAPAPPPVDPTTLSALSYAVVDVETTGMRAGGGDRITEIAAVIVRDGTVVERFETLVNPERPIPPMITALTDISWSMVKDAPRFRDICDDVLRLLEGRVFVAHNAEFDWRFLTAEVARATGRRLDGQRLCTVRLARRLLPHLRSRRLDAVAYHYGIEIPARHRAGGDAVATAHVLLRLLRDARDRDCRRWEDLQRLLVTRQAAPRRHRPSGMPRPVDRDTTA
jgi:DNA polymerase-3 subunit epsilon